MGLCFFILIRHDLERISGIWEEKTEEWEKARERDGYIAFVFACPFLTAVLFGVGQHSRLHSGFRGEGRATELNGINTAFHMSLPHLVVPPFTLQ